MVVPGSTKVEAMILNPRREQPRAWRCLSRAAPEPHDKVLRTRGGYSMKQMAIYPVCAAPSLQDNGGPARWDGPRYPRPACLL